MYLSAEQRDQFYDLGFYHALLRVEYEGRVLKRDQRRWFNRGEAVAQEIRKRYPRSVYSMLFSARARQKQARESYRRMEAALSEFGSHVPRTEPCMECPWIGLCAETGRVCALFRAYASTHSGGSSRVPDQTWDEYVAQSARNEDRGEHGEH